MQGPEVTWYLTAGTGYVDSDNKYNVAGRDVMWG